MSTIDRQRVAAVKTLVELGFTFQEGSWHPPPSTAFELGEAEFLATLACELRPPLNAVVILAEQLAHNLEGNLSPKQVEFARTIHSAGMDLANLTTDIVEMSKIMSGTVSLDIGDINVSKLIQEVVSPFFSKAATRSINFNVKVDVDGVIRTDGARLRQLLNNLLSHAFRSTLYGGVTLRSFASSGRRVLDGAATSQTIAFEMNDTGTSVQPGNRRLLFQNLEQDGPTNSHTKYRGRGLELAISSELAKLLGGELRMHSTTDYDNTLVLTLPIRGPDARQRSRER